MSGTPLNPGAAAPSRRTPPPPSKRWEKLMTALLRERPVQIERHDKTIAVSRAMEVDEVGNHVVIWTKRYGRDSDANPSIFNVWESWLLKKAVSST